jgi:succinate dehydrogenase/fumarate reductase flavoprotein subunit
LIQINGSQNQEEPPIVTPSIATRSAWDLVSNDVHSWSCRMCDLRRKLPSRPGPFRTQAKLDLATAKLERMSADLGDVPQGSGDGFDPVLLDWLDLRNMLLVARSVAIAAAARTESRGAQQREDHPGMDERWTVNQVVRLSDGRFDLSQSAPQRQGTAA